MDLEKRGFQLPKKLRFEEDTLTPTFGRLVAEPFERGFGTTVGNSLRRVLLSSLDGAAVTALRIPGVLHEFSAHEGIKEDVVDLVLNVKKLRFRMDSTFREKTVRVEVSGPAEVRGRDIQTDGTVEVLTPDQIIATVDKGKVFEMELTVRRGRGYVPAELNKNEDQPVDMVSVDAVFTPIRKVNLLVEKARVGYSTDYDRMILEVETDGSVSPEEAVSQAASVMKEHLDLFVIEDYDDGGESHIEDAPAAAVDEEPIFSEYLLKSIDELELSVRAYNCLKNAEIRTIGELVQRSEQEMLKAKNFGRKSLEEIKDTLAGMGLRLGMRVDTSALQEALATSGGADGEA